LLIWRQKLNLASDENYISLESDWNGGKWQNWAGGLHSQTNGLALGRMGKLLDGLIV
jgi:hypothetical protein